MGGRERKREGRVRVGEVEGEKRERMEVRKRRSECMEIRVEKEEHEKGV